ncbi:hypothetical protein [Cedecea davisae]|uniref:hypothetical protein n=1 Tax=Cedecea davisae TaxID=158484 RepID=UPI0024310C11|nr:hypothetical protein [Cedecea davisae]
MKSSEREHLANVAALGCIVCRNLNYGETPAEIHPTRNGQGIALRASNPISIPLCHVPHRTGGHGIAVHTGKQAWERNFSTEVELLDQVNVELGIVGYV